MLQTSAVELRTLAALKKLMRVPSLKDFVLVGGTGLALLKGHRLSADIDLFSHNVPINPDVMLPELSNAGKLSQKDVFPYALFLEFDGIKLDILKYTYGWIKPVIEEEGIRVASEDDIMAMKLAAITKRGSKKDFIDLYFLIKEHTIGHIVENFQKKFPDAEPYMTIKSITYFEDADKQDMPVLLKDKQVSWEQMKSAIEDAVKSMS